MATSFAEQIYAINKWAYQYYSRKTPVIPEKKVAWISSFVPVEILEALDVAYIYPESYAAVIAASGKEQDCLVAAQSEGLSLDCCGYSACFNGSLLLKNGPRGTPPSPDILIASSNQCNTLPNWWNLLAAKLGVPLIILDYPGEINAGSETAAYVEKQHRNLAQKLEILTGNTLDEERLAQIIAVSRENVSLWGGIVDLLPQYDIPAGVLFDDISPLIIARCRAETSELFKLLREEFIGYAPRQGTAKRIYWAGYPFWHNRDRCLAIDGMNIVGANYIRWWNLDYSGSTVWEMLYNAYNFTVLNRGRETRTMMITDDIRRVKAEGIIINRNKSCKRDFTSLPEADCPVPCVSIESDMIDRTYMDIAAAKERMAVLLSMLEN
jgi:benzoyl-CoA reductase/2-hydroxyglutaryl-CoA dehydratase subunit BcrC/BadD/HgdB